jgi:hypothetical protein
MHPAGVAILVIVLLLIAGGVGWILFTRIRAQRLGVCFLLCCFLSRLIHHRNSQSNPIQRQQFNLNMYLLWRVRPSKRNNPHFLSPSPPANTQCIHGLARQTLGQKANINPLRAASPATTNLLPPLLQVVRALLRSPAARPRWHSRLV